MVPERVTRRAGHRYQCLTGGRFNGEEERIRLVMETRAVTLDGTDVRPKTLKVQHVKKKRVGSLLKISFQKFLSDLKEFSKRTFTRRSLNSLLIIPISSILCRFYCLDEDYNVFYSKNDLKYFYCF